MAFIDFPPLPVIGQFAIGQVRTIPLQRGAFSLEESSLDFGGEMWTAELEIICRTNEAAGQLQAWFHDIVKPGDRGRLYTPLGTRGVLGTMASASRTLAASAVAGAASISMNSAPSGQTLLRGSYFSIRSHLYQVREDVTFTGSPATVKIFPRLRQAESSGETVDFTNARSLWKLQGNQVPDLARRELHRPEPITVKLAESIK